MGLGIRIRHATARSTMVLVPVMVKPLAAGPADICPGCRLIFGQQFVHPVKTVHLWLDDTGACLVSAGVLEDLKLAGLPDIQIVGHTDNPPPLAVGIPREKQDHQARGFILRR